MSDGLVILDSVQKTFLHSAKPALEGVSAVLKPGQITGLVGPDGAGKTTLIRLMAGLLAPTSGSISVDHCDPIRDADMLRAFIGYMPQNSASTKICR